MDIVFAPAKDAANLAKHGVSLALAAEMDWDDALIRTDDRHDYKEQREIAIAFIGLRLHVAVYVIRDDQRRMISLRKANQREFQLYAEN